MSHSWVTKSVLALSTFAFCSAAFGSGNSGITYQGRILKPDGTPLVGANVQFRLQIRTPNSNNCLMYEEVQALDMRNSGGQFSLTINDGSGSRMDTTGLGLDRIFENRGSFTFSPATCQSGSAYTPTDGDGRNLVVLFKDETMAAWEPIPASKINYVPYAFSAQSVQGFGADSMLRVVNGSGDPITGLAPLSNAQYTALMDLVNGSSTAYTKAGQLNGVALPTMSSGEVLGWNGSAWVSTTSTPGANSITTAMIQNGAVDSSKIGAGAVGTSQIAGNVSISTSGTLASAITTTRDFKIFAPSPSTYYVGMLADPTLAASYTLTWPLTAGSANQVLTTDGSGKLTWTSPSSAGITDLTGDVTATGPGSAAATVASVGGSTASLVHSAELAANAATALNTPNTIVKRDGSGGFAAGAVSATSVTATGAVSGGSVASSSTITATGAISGASVTASGAVSGATVTASGAVTQGSSVFKDSGSNTVTVQAPTTLANSYVLKWPTDGAAVSGQVLTSDTSGNLSWVTPSGAPTGSAGGDLTGSYPNPSVATVGTSTAANIHTAEVLANAATDANTPSTIVKRDASGNFSAGAISATSVTSTGAVSGGSVSSSSTITATGAISGASVAVTGAVTGASVTATGAVTQGSSVYKDSGSNTVTVQAPTTVSSSYVLKWPTSAGGSGDVLSTDASGNLSWVTPSGAPTGSAGGDLTGSYPNPTVATVGTSTAANIHSAELLANAATSANTPNTIVKRDGSGNFSAGDITASNVKTDTLQLNNAGSVVNVVNPIGAAYTLTLPANTGTNGQVLTTNGSGVTSWTSALTSTTGFVQGGNTFGVNADLGTNDAYDLNLRTGGATKMTVTSAGNVGIGTTDPMSLLHVSGPSAAAYIDDGLSSLSLGVSGISSSVVENTPQGSGGRNQLELSYDPSAGSAAYLNFGFNFENDVVTRATVGSTSPLLFSVSTAPAMEIRSGGTSIIANGPGPYLSLESTDQTLNAGDKIGSLRFDNYDTDLVTTNTFAEIEAQSSQTVSNDTAAGNLLFKTTNNTIGAAPSEKMRIMSDGNVGIGTTAPATKLEVAGSLRVGDGGETCDASLTGAIRYNGGNLQFCAGSMPWTTLGVSGSGLTALTGDVTASGTGSVAATVVSVGGSTAANVHSAELLANAATDANTASTIVKRDASGNFSAGAISATSVTATGAITQGSAVFKDSGSNTVTVQAPTTVSSSYVLKWPTAAGGSDEILKTDASGNLSWTSLPTALPPNGSAGGDLTGSYPNPSVATVGTSTAADVHSAELLANAATAANTNNAIVKRDGTGNFTANVGTFNGVALNNAGSVVNLVNPLGAAYTLTLPTGTGTNGQVLTTNGSGVTSWSTALTSTTGFVNGGNTFGAIANLGTNDAYDLNLRTGGTTKMTVTSGGKVGIGTTAPKDDLDVRNKIFIGSQTTWPGLTIHAANVNYPAFIRLQSGGGTLDAPVAAGDDKSLGAINFDDAQYLSGGAQIQVYTTEAHASGALGSDMRFSTTANGTGTKAERLRITHDGNVGIGTTSPGYKLDVNGVINATGLKINGSDVVAGGGDFKSDGSVPMTGTLKAAAGTAALPSLTFDSDPDSGFYSYTGNAIGVATGGNVRFRFTNGGIVSETGGAFAITNGSSAANPTYTFVNNNDTGMFRATTDTLGFTTGGTEKMRITAAGNVGIGTTSPFYTFEVSGSNGSNTGGIANIANLANSNSRYSSLLVTRMRADSAQPPANWGAGIDFYNEGSSDGFVHNTGSIYSVWELPQTSSLNRYAALAFYTMNNGVNANGTERMRIDSSGNVGIGTTSPGYKLDVAGDVNVTGSFKVNGVSIGGGSGDFMKDGSVAMTGAFKASDGTATTPSITFGSDPTTGFYKVANGNVGFIANGTEYIRINNAFMGYDNSGARVASTVTNQALPSFTWAADTDTGIYRPTADTIGFSTSATEKMRITSAGNVGVGTSAPNGKLDVKGSIVMSGSTSGYTGFQPAAAAGSTIWTLPSADGTNGQVLQTDGAGLLSWTSPAAAGITALTGDVTASGSGSVTATVTKVNGVSYPASPSTNTVPVVTSANTITYQAVPAAAGGTGQTSYTTGDLLYASSSTALSKLSAGTSGYYLKSNGAGTAPSWAAVSASAPLSSITAAAAANTIDNTNYAQAWNWSTATTQTAMTMNMNALTTGSVLSLATSNNSLNSTNGLLSVVNSGSSTNGLLAKFQASSTAGSGLYVRTSGRVGIGTTSPATLLDVKGTLKLGNGGETCGASYAGGVRYNSSTIQFCNGSAWTGLGGATSIDDLSDAASSSVQSVANLFMGAYAGENRTTGASNTAIGYNAGSAITTGTDNTIVGAQYWGGTGPSTHSYTTAIGSNTLFNGVDGDGNTLVGSGAGDGNDATIGEENTYVGRGAGGNPRFRHTYNVGIGSGALNESHADVTIGVGPSAGAYGGGWHGIHIGDQAGYDSYGDENIFIGTGIFFNNSGGSTGGQNTIVGHGAAGQNIARTASNNVMFGYKIAEDLSSGNNNTVMGYYAASTLTTGSNNIVIGTGADVPASNTSNFLNIGNTIYGNTSTGNVGIGTTAPGQKLTVDGNIAPTTTNVYDLGTSSVLFRDAYVKNGVTTTSDARAKTDIRNSDLGLDFINDLRPVSYHWKEGDRKLHYGVIAQETERALSQAKARSGRSGEVDNVIVSHDKKTDVYGVRYTELIAPVIKAIQELYGELVGVKGDVESLKTQNAAQMAKLEAENQKLKQENAEMKARLDKIEDALSRMPTGH